MKYNFIVSPNRNAWIKNAEPYLYHVLEKNNKLGNYKDIKVAPHYRDTKEKLVVDNNFVDKKYEKYIPILSNRLNKIHETNFDEYFWKKSFSLSLIRYITFCYDIFQKCEDNFNAGIHECNILNKKSYYTPINFQDHRDFFQDTSFGQEQLFSIYINLFFPGKFNEFEENFVWPEAPGMKNNIFSKVRSRVSNITKDQVFEKILAFLFYFSSPKLVISGSFFSTKNINKLILSGRGKIKRMAITDNFCNIYKINIKHRRVMSEFIDDFDNFDRFFFKSIYSSFPVSFIENFKHIYSAYNAQISQYKGLKYIVNESFIGNHKSSIFIAIAQQSNVKHIYNEHNFLQHQFLCNNLKYIYPLVDKFVTLGWHKNGIRNLVPGSSYYDWRSNFKSKYKYGILFVTGPPSVKTPEFSSSYGDFGSFNSYSHLNFSKDFFSNLGVEILSCLTYKSYPLENLSGYHLKYPMISYDKEYYLDKYIRYCIKSTEINLMPAKRLMAESKLVVVDYLSTAYIESFIMNYPTIVLWNSNIYSLNKDHKEFYDELVCAGIVYTDPVEAAKFIEKIYKNPNSWWMSKRVQKAKDKFIHSNIKNNKSLFNIIVNSIKE